MANCLSARPVGRAGPFGEGMRRFVAIAGFALLAACGGPMGGDPDGFTLVYDPRVDSAEVTETYARQLCAQYGQAPKQVSQEPMPTAPAARLVRYRCIAVISPRGVGGPDDPPQKANR